MPIVFPGSDKAEILRILSAKGFASATHIAVCRVRVLLGVRTHSVRQRMVLSH